MKSLTSNLASLIRRFLFSAAILALVNNGAAFGAPITPKDLRSSSEVIIRVLTEAVKNPEFNQILSKTFKIQKLGPRPMAFVRGHWVFPVNLLPFLTNDDVLKWVRTRLRADAAALARMRELERSSKLLIEQRGGPASTFLQTYKRFPELVWILYVPEPYAWNVTKHSPILDPNWAAMDPNNWRERQDWEQFTSRSSKTAEVGFVVLVAVVTGSAIAIAAAADQISFETSLWQKSGCAFADFTCLQEYCNENPDECKRNGGDDDGEEPEDEFQVGNTPCFSPDSCDILGMSPQFQHEFITEVDLISLAAVIENYSAGRFADCIRSPPPAIGER